jgi:hypothetical protein
MSDFPRNTIRASEIGQFVYCRHAWYLGSVLQRPSANLAELDAGAQAHRRHGRRVASARGVQRAALALAILGVLLLLAYLTLKALGG